jgi:high-affinity nickel-transport protein
VRSLAGPVRDGGSQLHRVSGSIGTLVSGGFLYLIAALNVAILLGIVRVLVRF